eukprot:3682290-Prymnesium_polylepis.2
MIWERSREWNGQMDWLASSENDDIYRWDCQMADPSFAILENGTTLIAYRGTQCEWRANETFQEVRRNPEHFADRCPH